MACVYNVGALVPAPCSWVQLNGKRIVLPPQRYASAVVDDGRPRQITTADAGRWPGQSCQPGYRPGRWKRARAGCVFCGFRLRGRRRILFLL